MGVMSSTSLSASSLAERTEARRVDASRGVADEKRSEFGQFFTPGPVADLLASMFEPTVGPTRILDAGAGSGSLTAALVGRMVREQWPVAAHAHAVEFDSRLQATLQETLHECELTAVDFTAELHQADFIEWAVDRLSTGLFVTGDERFELAILNPPYRKLNTASRERQLLRAAGIETSNLYSAFVALSLRLLEPGGQLVAITPRSFCNGPYFTLFRELILREAAVRRIHLFGARDTTFRDSSVLQENVIFHLVKGRDQGAVIISSSDGSGGDVITSRLVEFDRVVHTGDQNKFIHLVTDAADSGIATRIGQMDATIGELDVCVSTGRVVDFRAQKHLRTSPEPGTVPLLYPMHLRDGRVQWPGTSSKKACAMATNAETTSLLLPNGNYVLVKRFSSKRLSRLFCQRGVHCEWLVSRRRSMRVSATQTKPACTTGSRS